MQCISVSRTYTSPKLGTECSFRWTIIKLLCPLRTTSSTTWLCQYIQSRRRRIWGFQEELMNRINLCSQLLYTKTSNFSQMFAITLLADLVNTIASYEHSSRNINSILEQTTQYGKTSIFKLHYCRSSSPSICYKAECVFPEILDCHSFLPPPCYEEAFRDIIVQWRIISLHIVSSVHTGIRLLHRYIILGRTLTVDGGYLTEYCDSQKGLHHLRLPLRLIDVQSMIRRTF